MAPVVVAVRLRHDQDLSLAGSVGPVRVAGVDREPRYHGASGVRGRVVDVEVAVRLVRRVEGESEQPLLVAPVADPFPDVHERADLRGVRPVFEEDDLARLQHHEQPVVGVRRVGEVDHALQRDVGERGLDFQLGKAAGQGRGRGCGTRRSRRLWGLRRRRRGRRRTGLRLAAAARHQHRTEGDDEVCEHAPARSAGRPGTAGTGRWPGYR